MRWAWSSGLSCVIGCMLGSGGDIRETRLRLGASAELKRSGLLAQAVVKGLECGACAWIWR